MGLKGKLDIKDYFGEVVPVTDPACCKPLHLYRNITMMAVTYETDYDAVAGMLPKELEFANDPPQVTVMVSDLSFSNLGEYGEAFLIFAAKYKGKDINYCPNLFVTQEVPLIAGREIWGFPKKLAKIDITHQRNQFIGVIERPHGNKLFDVIVSPEVNLKASDWVHKDSVVIKQIPRSDGKALEVCKLVGVDYHLSPVVGTDGIAEFWSCTGSITFHSQSTDDPWWKAKVNKVIGAVYGKFNISLPYGYDLLDYQK